MYPCLTAFIMTEPWLKQPKILPCHITVECQTMKMHQPPQNFCKYAFPDWCRDEFGSSKIYFIMFYSFYYDWTLAEAAKNAARPHCCRVPKLKVLELPQHSCKKAFPDSCRNEFGSNKTYTCTWLTAFIMTQHSLKQPKMLPSHIVVECQTMKMHQPLQQSWK